MKRKEEMPPYTNPKNKIIKAVALKYDQNKDQTPKVVAKGQGELAERIIELAKKHNVHLKEDPHLMQFLEKCELDEEIPYEAFAAVAEILVYLYRLQGKLKNVPNTSSTDNHSKID